MLQIAKKTIAENYDQHFSGSAGVLRTLAYFDIFHYPLTKREIANFLFAQVEEEVLEKWLLQLEKDHHIFYNKGFYSLHDNPLLAYRRIRGNERAAVLLEKARRIGRFLFQFPFVKGIGISGSLSKNFADEKADIDFFIITQKNRLWIARTLMHLYKKFTFFTGHEHYYCMNYYIDETAFEITERNLFTATEVKTLLPVCGQNTMKQFFSCNDWANRWLPGSGFRSQDQPDPPASWLKRIGEWLFSNRAGNLLETILFRISTKRWNRKAKRIKRNRKGAPMALVTGVHFAKSNPGEFQEKVLGLYREKLSELRKGSKEII
jgi:hypothetical protein